MLWRPRLVHLHNVLEAKPDTYQVVEGKLGTFRVLCLYVKLLALLVIFEVGVAFGHSCAMEQVVCCFFTLFCFANNLLSCSMSRVKVPYQVKRTK